MPYAVSIGFFDGVHIGHVFLLRQLQQLARERALQTMAVTFSTHPQLMLKGSAPALITTLDDKISLLRKTGINQVQLLNFADIQHLTAAEFIQLLHKDYGVQLLLMGYNHRFGSDNISDISLYRQWGEESGVEVLTALPMPDVKVSSSIIRKLVAAGDILTANSLLGRPFRLSGIVVHGKGIGKSLGFPTANLSLAQPDLLLPSDGVYEAVVNGEKQALVNIGCNPTMDATQRTIEVHIPLFEGNLYNTLLTIDFIRKIRDEKKFSSLLELQQQIHRDLLSLQK